MKNLKDTIFNILSKKDKRKYKFIFVGAGGISMYSLAIFIKNLGHEVVGIDAKKSDNTDILEQNGIKVYIGHAQKNIANFDFVVYSYAVEFGLEVQEAKRLNIPTISRAELLGVILKLYKTSICVAGAHGKTTTTALIYHILNTAKINSDLHLGGFLVEGDKSYSYSKGGIIVSEACEYKDAFLHFKPTIAVVLNVEAEHLDYFKTFSNVQKSFNKFAKSANMLICASSLLLDNQNKIAFNGGNFNADNKSLNSNGTHTFNVLKNGKLYMGVTPKLLGEHNIANVLASIAVCDFLGVDANTIKLALESFKGVKRRLEILHKKRFIVHDYAHHPDEIGATLKSINNYYKGKLLVVFQPHTYTRTKLLKDEFINCFKGQESLVIYKTYSAREKYIKDGSAKSLCKEIDGAVFIKNKKDLTNYVINKISNGYGVVFLGAGDIDKIAHVISDKLKF